MQNSWRGTEDDSQARECWKDQLFRLFLLGVLRVGATRRAHTFISTPKWGWGALCERDTPHSQTQWVLAF